MNRLTACNGWFLRDILNDEEKQIFVYSQLKEYENMFESLGIEPSDLHKIVVQNRLRGQLLRKVRING